MNQYKIPDENYFRLHHPRPRFKSDIENVLIYIAGEIARIGERPREEFVKEINEAIYHYPGNAHKELKTIQNWRTEISSLFGFIEHTEETEKPGRRALELADHQDLIESFKVFLYNFQYPGAHIKNEYILPQIKAGIHFKPARYILQLLKYAEASEGKRTGITKAEACHCIFNDLRVTRDNEGVQKTWERISENRKKGVEYDTAGDIIRYAGDIIDYMVTANLLETHDNRTYYLNPLEEEDIVKFCESEEWFTGFDDMIEKRDGSLKEIEEQRNQWFSYVNRNMDDTDLATDVVALIAKDRDDYNELVRQIAETSREISERIRSGEEISFTTKEIGDIGEYLVHAHECMRVKLGGREDLIHLIKRIPSQFAVGYDISSVELDEKKRYIEVKSTVSSKPLDFKKIHMTRNEWNAADTNREHYFVYRLYISKDDKKLYIIQNPVGLYKQDEINMVPYNDGADIEFDPEKAGHYTELLTWKN